MHWPSMPVFCISLEINASDDQITGLDFRILADNPGRFARESLHVP